MNNALWDMAGVDGLAVAKYLFGEEVGYLAPFQSMETSLGGQDCSVLRLCDRNFRISYPGSLQAFIEPLQANIWLKQFGWLTSMVLPDHFFSTIISHATVRPPHRLKTIPNHQAVPAQLQGIAILLWRHPHQRQSSLELHIAQKDLKILEKVIATDITEAVQ